MWAIFLYLPAPSWDTHFFRFRKIIHFQINSMSFLSLSSYFPEWLGWIFHPGLTFPLEYPFISVSPPAWAGRAVHCALTGTKKPDNIWTSRAAHHISQCLQCRQVQAAGTLHGLEKELCGNVYHLLLHLGSEGWAVQRPEEGNRD